MNSFYIYALGCKVNSYEIEAIKDDLLNEGYVMANEFDADYLIYYLSIESYYEENKEIYWENILLNEAKKNLHHYDERGRKLGDIELLAKLQHYGAATRLLDFSKNVLIALWFCVSDREYKDKTGLLLGIDTDIVTSSISAGTNVDIPALPSAINRITNDVRWLFCLFGREFCAGSSFSR